VSQFKFEIGQLVLVEGIECQIISREIYDDAPDYLCRPLDGRVILAGTREPGAGWIRDNLMKAKTGGAS
jgi:hypothetical protein